MVSQKWVFDPGNNTNLFCLENNFPETQLYYKKWVGLER